MPVIGLDHVQLAMPPGAEAEARRFYGGLLGLTEVPKPPPLAARGGCWFANGDVSIHLGVQEDFVPARKAHPALLVTDLEAYRRVLEEAGFPVKPDDVLSGVRRFFTADPCGNRLELIQAGES